MGGMYLIQLGGPHKDFTGRLNNRDFVDGKLVFAGSEQQARNLGRYFEVSYQATMRELTEKEMQAGGVSYQKKETSDGVLAQGASGGARPDGGNGDSAPAGSPAPDDGGTGGVPKAGAGSASKSGGGSKGPQEQVKK